MKMKKYKVEGITKRTDLVYALGLDSCWDKVSKLPKENIQKQKIDRLIEFIDLNGRIPKAISDDKNERSLVTFTESIKQGDSILSEDNLAYIKSSKHAQLILNMLETNKDTQLKNLVNIKHFIQVHGNQPQSRSSDKYERKLASVLGNLRQAFHEKKSTHIIYNETKLKIIEVGMEYLFKLKTPETLKDKQLNNIINLVKWINVNGTLPKRLSRLSTDIEENKLSIFRDNLKRAINGKGTMKLYPETIEYFNIHKNVILNIAQ